MGEYHHSIRMETFPPHRYGECFINLHGISAKYAAYAINSHDKLVAENERLRNALECTTNHSPDTAKMVAHEGWQLVPKVPTRDMIEQGNAAMAYDCCSGDASDAYHAMLAAAPKLRD